MNRYLLKLAWASSWRGGVTSAVRSALLAVAAAGAVVCLGVVVSTVHFAQRVNERSERRAFAPAASGEPAVMHRHVVFDATIDGDQIYVYWISPVEETLTVPGLPERADVGDWFVSPELARRMDADVSLAERFPNARQIEETGVARPDELIAYRLVDAATVGIGDPLTVTLAARTSRSDYLADPSDIAPGATAIAGAAIIGLPAIGLVLAGMSPSVYGARRRLRLLEALGAAPSVTRTVLSVGTALAAGPGVLVGAIGWWFVSRRIVEVPLVGRRVFVGDLALPVSSLIAIVVTTLAACILGVSGRRSEVATQRPGRTVRVTPSSVRFGVLAAGFGLLLRGAGLLGSPNDTVFFAGVIASAVGVSVSLPVVLTRTGQTLARSRGLTGLLVGKRLVWNSTTATRTLIGLCSLLVLLPVGSAWVAANRASTTDAADLSDPQPVWINGPLNDADTRRIVTATDSAVFLLVETAASDDGAAPDVKLVSDCLTWPTVASELGRCNGARFELSEPATEALRRFVPRVTGSIVGTAPAAASNEHVVATIFVGPDWQAVDAWTRQLSVNARSPLPQVGYTMSTSHEGPSVRWVLAGLLIGAVTAVAALCIRLAATTIESISHRRRLTAIGIEESDIRTLTALETATPVFLAGFIATSAGLAAAHLYTHIDPYAKTQLAVGAGILALVSGTAAITGAASWILAGGEPEHIE